MPGISPFTSGLTANVIAPVADGRPLYAPDRNNLQPRLGAAWSFGESASSVPRAAYGTYADRPFQGLWDFGVLNYPRVDGSTSAHPLATVTHDRDDDE